MFERETGVGEHGDYFVAFGLGRVRPNTPQPARDPTTATGRLR
jgi:hypothetical protein